MASVPKIHACAWQQLLRRGLAHEHGFLVVVLIDGQVPRALQEEVADLLGAIVALLAVVAALDRPEAGWSRS